MRVAVEEWELYNNGILLCKWFDLENVAIEEIEEYIKEVKKQHDLNHEDIEAFIADVEDDDFNIISGDESLEYAYEVQELRNTIEDNDLPKIAFLTSIQGYEIEDAINKVDDCTFYENMTFNDLAEEFIQDGIFGEDVSRLYETNCNWLDIDAIARDLEYDYAEYNGDIFRCD